MMMTMMIALLALQPLVKASNIFADNPPYVNDIYRQRLQTVLSKPFIDNRTKTTLRAMQRIGSAFWVDRIAKIRGSGVTLQSVVADASKSVPRLVVAVLYNVPNRDCHAEASNGELCCQYAHDGTCAYAAADASCSEGLNRYRKEYVDEFASVLELYPAVPVAIVIEPDSLANLATNTADWRCGNPATRSAYLQGIRYAIETLAQRVPRAMMYLDAGHGGWLGWPDKADAYLEVVQRLGDAASHLRGFATNVANYQPLGKPCPAAALSEGWPQLGPQYCDRHGYPECCTDPCGLLSQYSNGNNEHNYAQLLAARLKRTSALRSRLPSPRFVIDSGRNGRDDVRKSCSNWCNIRGAAIGLAPTSDTLLPNLIDGYFWLKTPGESDGCTAKLPDGTACGRYDGMCGSEDSLGSQYGEPWAPEAGEWFMPQFVELACRARLDGRIVGPGEDERCDSVIAAATRSIMGEQAVHSHSSLPPPAASSSWNAPRSRSREWQGQYLQASEHAQRRDGRPSNSSGREILCIPADRVGANQSSWIVLLFSWLFFFFVVWFVFPRFKAPLRRAVGYKRYDTVEFTAVQAALAIEQLVGSFGGATVQCCKSFAELMQRIRLAGLPTDSTVGAIKVASGDPESASTPEVE